MKLATIQTISEVVPHPNADRLTIYKMNGLSWRVISAEKFQIGDKVGYIQTDTVVEERPEYEFLRKNNFRIKCIRLRGEYSNGLIIPLSDDLKALEEGTDISEQLGVSKYEKPVTYKSGDAAGDFPTSLLSKTDEDKIENHPELIEQFKNKEVYISLKSDGSSVTIINHEEKGFMVCSRNLEIKESQDNKYWQPVFKYNLKENLPVGFALQGELVGQGIQTNPEGVKGVDIRVFRAWRLEERKILDYRDLLLLCKKLDIPMVDTYYIGKFQWETVEEMIEEARKARYANGAVAEGLVWTLCENEWSDVLQKPLSVKTINYDYKE